MQASPMDGSPMDGSPMDGSPMDGSPMDGSPMDGSPMDGSSVAGLSERAARGVALATLAVACVVVGPAPRLLDTFERTFVVALAEQGQRAQPQRRVLGRVRRSWRPRGARPPHLRP